MLKYLAPVMCLLAAPVLAQGMSVKKLDPALDNVIAPNAKIEKVATGFIFSSRRSPPCSKRQGCPRAPVHRARVMGAWTTPATATPSTARPMCTANMPLRSTNSRVPSRGSTNHTRRVFGATWGDSSATTSSAGNAARRPATISSLAR